MHDTSVSAAHHHAPTSFIRKHVFSLDHKVIGKQYYALALAAALHRNVLLLDDAYPPGVDERARYPACSCFRRAVLLAA